MEQLRDVRQANVLLFFILFEWGVGCYRSDMSLCQTYPACMTEVKQVFTLARLNICLHKSLHCILTADLDHKPGAPLLI